MTYVCDRCREVLADDQAQCPFCDNPAKPMDESCWYCHAPADTEICGKGGCPLGGDL